MSECSVIMLLRNLCKTVPFFNSSHVIVHFLFYTSLCTEHFYSTNWEIFQFYENIVFVCLFVLVYLVILNSTKWAVFNLILFIKHCDCLFICVYLFGDTLQQQMYWVKSNIWYALQFLKIMCRPPFSDLEYRFCFTGLESSAGVQASHKWKPFKVGRVWSTKCSLN